MGYTCGVSEADVQTASEQEDDDLDALARGDINPSRLLRLARVLARSARTAGIKAVAS